MKISIAPTDKIEMVNGVRCREWIGITDKDVPVTLQVALISVKGDQDQADFLRELNETRVDRQLAYFDNRLLD